MAASSGHSELLPQETEAQATTGPASARELLHYPDHVVRCMLCDDPLRNVLRLPAKDALAAVANRGIRLYTRYSGIGMPEIVWHILQKQIFPHFGLSNEKFVTHEEAWDIKPTARRILMDLDGPVRPQHVFGDMMEGMLKGEVRNLIPLLASDATDTSWTDLKSLMWEADQRILRQNAHCYIHDRHCRFGPRVRCHRLLLCVAGITCKDFSRANRVRRGLLGPSGRVLLVFIMEVRQSRYDLVLTECTTGQDLSPFEEFLSPMYHWFSWCWGPEDGGWMTHRPRRFCLFVLKHEFGGRCSFAGTPDMFKSVYQAERPSHLDGSMFAMSNAAGIEEALRQFGDAESRQHLQSTADRAGAWERAMSGSLHARLQLYRIAFLEAHGMDFNDMCRLSPGELRSLARRMAALSSRPCLDKCCDLESSPAWRSSCGVAGMTTHLPTLTHRNSWFWLLLDRCLTADEELLSQGLCASTIDAAPSPIHAPWLSAWSELLETEKKDLVGNTINGMVLMSVFAFLVRCLDLELPEGSTFKPDIVSGREPGRPGKKQRQSS